MRTRILQGIQRVPITVILMARRISAGPKDLNFSGCECGPCEQSGAHKKIAPPRAHCNRNTSARSRRTPQRIGYNHRVARQMITPSLSDPSAAPEARP
jgi:hypothetical protein